MQRTVPFLVFLMLAILTMSPRAHAAGPKHAAAPPAPTHAEPVAADDPGQAEAPAEQGTEATPPAPHGPVTMKVGLRVADLNKFDLAQGTYTAEFFVTIHCDKEPCKPDLDVANGKIAGKIEKLDDKPLYKEFKIKADLNALVDLSAYPFDSHKLPIVIQDKGDPEEVKYVSDAESTGLATFKLPGWDITGSTAGIVEQDPGDGSKISQLHFYIDVSRPTLMATFKSIVPVLIMLFVAAFTLLLKPKSASGRLATATGGLMSIVMFQVGQVGSLPPLGYLTRLDKFMIATYLVYLLNIFFSVAMVRLEEKKNERMSEFMYLAAAGAVPGLALIVWLGVFLRLV